MKRACGSLLFFMSVAGLFLCGSAWRASAQQSGMTVEVSSRAELLAAVHGARPGTHVLIAPGEYSGGLAFENLRGTEALPILLEAKRPDQPPMIVGGSFGIHLRKPAHVELRGLVVRGATDNGLNIDDGGDADGSARKVVLRGVQVRDIGPSGNHDGIKLSGVEDFVVDNCVVERWGDGGSAVDMVGCHNGEIKNCRFRFRGDISGNGVQTKGGSADIAIRGCLFENAGSRSVNLGGSTGLDFFRPRDADFEARNITVEDCTFVGSMSPIAFVGVDGARVRYNTIYRPSRWVMRILQESQGPRFVPCWNGVFSNNIIVFRADELRTVVNVGEGTAAETFQFAGNHWFCMDHPERSSRLGLPTPQTGGSYGVDPMFRDPERGDFELRDPSVVSDAGVRALSKSEK